MATPVLRYRFAVNTPKLEPQLELNWQAGFQRSERAYGRSLVKQLVPGFKIGETRWPERLAALRERLKTGPKIDLKALGRLGGSGRWLLPALLAEAKQGPHPGTSLLEVEIEALPGGGLSLALKSEHTACMRQVAVVLRDFAPESEIAAKLARPIARGDVLGYERVFFGVLRTEGVARGRASTRCWPRPSC